MFFFVAMLAVLLAVLDGVRADCEGSDQLSCVKQNCCDSTLRCIWSGFNGCICSAHDCLCPSNCAMSSWGSWSSWSTCSQCIQKRSRTFTGAACRPCPGETEHQACNDPPQSCRVDCVVSSWSEWSTCAQNGSQTRTRSIETQPQNGGECPHLTETRQCSPPCSPQNCTLSEWSSWSMCTATCGSGIQSRNRAEKANASCGGSCDKVYDSQPCTVGPTNCVWSPFSNWSGCSVTCGTGTRTRSRTKQAAETCGGTCPGEAMDVSTCTQNDCPLPPVDCQVSPWAEWSQCSATCGTSAVKSRARTVVQSTQRGGTQCPSLSETVNCGFGCCPVSCAVSLWNEWSRCSVTCGSGVRKRFRTVTTEAECGGSQCAPLEDDEPCSQAACAVDCVLSMWSNWSQCSQQCGNGELRRERNVTMSPANGGAACGQLTESRTCSQGACSCAVTEWSTWTACSVTCGGGMATRSRTVTVSASDCPSLSDVRPCGMMPCARDCVISAWSSWSACSVSCGGGRRTRARFVTQSAVEPGMACPIDLADSEVCNTQNCTSAGMLCSQYAACNDCTDNAKTAPHVCQFCAKVDGSGGACRNLYLTAGDRSSGLQGCPIGFDARVTSPAQCTPALPPATTTTSIDGSTTNEEIVIDVAGMLGIGATPVDKANATLPGGVPLDLRVAGPPGATVQSGDRDGIGALREGISIELNFAGRKVSITRLELGSWDATDSARLEFSNAPKQKRQMGSVDVVSAEQSTADATRDGFSHYVLVAGQGSDFKLKSFAFIDRTATQPSLASSSEEQHSEMDGLATALRTFEIALIAVFAALCLIITIIVVVVVLVVRHRRRRHRDEQVTSGQLTAEEISTNTVEMDTVPIPSTREANYGPITAIQPPSGTGIYAGAPEVVTQNAAPSGPYDTVPEATQLIRYEAFQSSESNPIHNNAGFYDSPDSEFQK